MQMRPPPAVDMGRANAVVGMIDDELFEMLNDGNSMSVVLWKEMDDITAAEFATFGDHARRFLSVAPPDEVSTSEFMFDTYTIFHIIHARVMSCNMMYAPTVIDLWLKYLFACTGGRGRDPLLFNAWTSSSVQLRYSTRQ